MKLQKFQENKIKRTCFYEFKSWIEQIKIVAYYIVKTLEQSDMSCVFVIFQIIQSQHHIEGR